MAKRMPRGLVALSASAVATIYVAGYLTTQAADARLAATDNQPQAVVSAPAAAVPTPFVLEQRPVGGPASASGPASSGPSATSATSATAAYRDGVYQGSGTSRRGWVSVAVTVQAGRISNVAFTQVTTQYPVSRIAGLPAQVVSRQSAQVDRVSGATYSAQAFQQAVQQALAQAQAGGAATATSSRSGVTS